MDGWCGAQCCLWYHTICQPPALCSSCTWRVCAFVSGLPYALPLPAGQGNIYQSIFLDDQQSQHWTVGEIDSDSVLKRRVTRQVGPGLRVGLEDTYSAAWCCNDYW